jgi:hypothetical protein
MVQIQPWKLRQSIHLNLSGFSVERLDLNDPQAAAWGITSQAFALILRL